jgi:hypothetical protein
MPRLVPISNPETPALLALRRTLWQLAFVGIAIAVAIARIAPESGTIALWCVLIPLSALAAHYRYTLLDMLQFPRGTGADHSAFRRPQQQRPQARRAYGAGPASRLRRLPRTRQPRDPAHVGPLAR